MYKLIFVALLLAYNYHGFTQMVSKKLSSERKIEFDLNSNLMFHQGNKLSIETSVAIYNPETQTLNCYFFPYQLSEQEIQKVINDELHVVLADKESPGTFWEQPVYAKLEIEIEDGENINEKKSFQKLIWSFTGFTERESVSRLMIPQEDIDASMIQEFNLKLNDKESKLRIIYRGQEIIDEQFYMWVLDFDIPVFKINGN